VEAKAMDLFNAFSEGKLPLEGGYIVTSFFQDNSTYAKYEVVAYSNAKSLFLSDEGLIFQTDGNKLFVLVEPADYERKDLEPFSRDGQRQIPHSFGEVELITASNGARIMFSRQPVVAYSSFTITKPTTLSFSILFYNLPDVFASISAYFQKTLSAEAGLPAVDATAAAERIVTGLKRFTIWQELVAKAAPPAPKVIAPKKAAKKAVAKKKPAAKKAAAKKPAAGKPAAKKTAAKKKPPKRRPAPKKAARKKPAVKKLAAKRAAAKKPAAKKAAPKKAAVRKAAPKKKAKSAARKPAAKKKARKR
jgi:hypothetical protein